MNSELKPKIRFKGFTDDWEPRKLSDNLKNIQTGTNLLGSINNLGTPLLKMGNIQRGYFTTDKLEYLKDYSSIEKENIANFGDFFFNTRNTLELVGKGATWFGISGKYAFNSNIARFTFEGINTTFFNYLYNTESLLKQVHSRATGTTSVAAIYPQSLNTIEYMLPSYDEQSKIGNLLLDLDNLITLHQRKYDKLIELKKSLLEKMFPQNNSIIPEIRFKGFTDDWEQRKLSTLIRKPITDGPHETPQLLTSGIPFISVEAIHDGIIDLKKCRGYISEYDDKRFKQKYIPEIGDVFFTKAATIGRVAVVDKLGFNIWSPIGAIKPDFSKTISKYLYYVLQTDNIMKEALLGSNSSSQYNLSMDTIENFTINIPKSINEQVEVSKLLTNIDNLITLHQRKHDKLNKIKESLLNDMFV